MQSFQIADVPRAGLLGRLFGRVPREAAFVQIRNLLATVPFNEVRSDDVSTILASAKLTTADVVPELQGLYEQAIHSLCADHDLSAEDAATLAVLAKAFDLPAVAVAEARDRAIAAVYETAVREALVDHVFSQFDRDRLAKFATTLGLNDTEKERIFLKAARDALAAAYRLALGDGVLRVGEEEALLDFAASLDAKVTLEGESAKLMTRARTLGQIEQGLLPSVLVGLVLNGDEICHFASPALAQYEMRIVTKRIDYSGPVASIRIMKGVRWRVGSISTSRVTRDVLTHIDVGDFYITSRKLFFQGVRKNTSIMLGKVMQFHVFKDGLQVEKESGKDFYCVGDADWQLAGACLNALTRGVK
jgi:hypothetical protein